jgi:hypothetical protein
VKIGEIENFTSFSWESKNNYCEKSYFTSFTCSLTENFPPPVFLSIPFFHFYPCPECVIWSFLVQIWKKFRFFFQGIFSFGKHVSKYLFKGKKRKIEGYKRNMGWEDIFSFKTWCLSKFIVKLLCKNIIFVWTYSLHSKSLPKMQPWTSSYNRYMVVF